MSRLVFFVWMGLFPSLAQAGLGDLEAQVASDVSALHVQQQQHQVQHRAAYTAHVLQSGRQTIHEYVNSGGTVFAVAWQGSPHPNLPVLLSSQFQTLQTMGANRTIVRHGRGPTSFRSGNMVLHFGGHGRDLRGSAYLSNLVPSGVDPENLQ